MRRVRPSPQCAASRAGGSRRETGADRTVARSAHGRCHLSASERPLIPLGRAGCRPASGATDAEGATHAGGKMDGGRVGHDSRSVPKGRRFPRRGRLARRRGGVSAGRRSAAQAGGPARRALWWTRTVRRNKARFTGTSIQKNVGRSPAPERRAGTGVCGEEGHAPVRCAAPRAGEGTARARER